ncbi:ABC transporter permease (plasmid) [Kovacikia minuta CCNUW1]|uniref:ABC transporter permease n=1 Tax=Kovacikia minuta TaxID=2931930 RepID=UPI001CCAFD43|nr:ABC transporter permease [Kovacikia minuta]UBF30601.1 ABC transporter permease [Kovacikia minuta CCNUW1]
MTQTFTLLHRFKLKIPLPFWGLAVGLFIWWLLTTPLWHHDPIVADFSPERTFVALLQLFSTGTIFSHIATSLRRVLVGLVAAIALGVPLGILLGLSRPLDQATSALFQFIRMISPLSWMPLAVMVLGIGDLPVYFLLTIAAVWPLILNTTAGVAAVDRRWLLLSRSLCATQGETIRRVIIPAIIPHLLTGVRLAIGIIWIVLVPAEMLGVSAGLGYYILDTRDRLAYSELMAVVLLIGAIGYLLDGGLRLVYHRWTHL